MLREAVLGLLREHELHVHEDVELGIGALDLPRPLAAQGSGTSTATETSTDTRGACRRVAAKGTFTGSFRTRFAGWGARIAAFGRSGSASYAEESA